MHTWTHSKAQADPISVNIIIPSYPLLHDQPISHNTPNTRVSKSSNPTSNRSIETGKREEWASVRPRRLEEWTHPLFAPAAPAFPTTVAARWCDAKRSRRAGSGWTRGAQPGRNPRAEGGVGTVGEALQSRQRRRSWWWPQALRQWRREGGVTLSRARWRRKEEVRSRRWRVPAAPSTVAAVVVGIQGRRDARPRAGVVLLVAREKGVVGGGVKRRGIETELGFSFLFSQKLDQPHFCSVHLPP